MYKKQGKTCKKAKFGRRQDTILGRVDQKSVALPTEL
jgi:hypothetical protein